MLSNVFYFLLNTSILGGAMCLLVLLLRKIKVIPRTIIYLLWLIPFLRFALPFGVSSRYSLLSLLSKYATKTVVVYEKTEALPELTMTNSVMAAKEYFPVVYKTNRLEGIFHIASIVWVIGAVAALVAAFLLYRKMNQSFKGAVHLKDNVYVSDHTETAVLYGILHPRIILPKGLSEKEIGYITMHEQVHAARRDNLWRTTAIFLCALHWFNPLIWISLKYFLEDMELACDAAVIRKLKDEEVKEYALIVLGAAAGKNMLLSAFGGAGAKQRITNIVTYRKLTVFSAICFAVLVIGAIIILTTNASA